VCASSIVRCGQSKEDTVIDHRTLGRELELYHGDALVGAGLPMWLPAGAAARYAVESYLRREEARDGYLHVYSPPLGRRELYQRSGHLPYYAEEMFPPMPDGEDALVLRPSLCPHHAMIFAARGRSYRELPVRLAEMGGMYRRERSGVLSGLSRVRAISLNDGHIFCGEEQLAAELAREIALVRRVHAALGVAPASWRLSRRAAGDVAKYVGPSERWDWAEGVLRSALADAGVSYVEAPGEAAFYGPKIDIQVSDHADREFTLATMQLDAHQPERFDLSYMDSAGERRRPVMLHRSVVGSFERLFAHLIELHEGAFPAWYAPLQVACLPVSDEELAAAENFVALCRAADLRVDLVAGGSLAARVRQVRLRRVPYQAVIGPAEVAAGEVVLRPRGGKDFPSQPLAQAVARLRSLAAAPDHRATDCREAG
jgi:threonyl-tRNA synthetase